MKSCLHVLIPALNEERNIPLLLNELVPCLESLERPWTFLLVDDGSTDETATLAQQHLAGHRATVKRHGRNLGPGAAFVTGFRTLLEVADDDDAVVTLEADRTSDLGVLPTLLERFDGGADVVLASVYHPEGRLEHTALHRRLLSQGANCLLRQLFRMSDVKTFSSFYRVYRVSTLRRAMKRYGLRLIEEPGFASVVELLIRLHRMGARIEEVPMVLDSRRRIGESRMRIGRTVRAYIRMMARQRLESIALNELEEV